MHAAVGQVAVGGWLLSSCISFLLSLQVFLIFQLQAAVQTLLPLELA